MSKLFDRYAGLVFLIVGAAFMIESRRISESAYGSQVGPDIFPFGLGLVLALLSARLIYETFKYPAAKGNKGSYDVKRFAILFGAALLYAISLEQIGYILDTFLFLLIGFQTMQRGKWWSSLLIAALMSYGVYYVFVDILQGTLPGWPVWLSQ